MSIISTTNISDLNTYGFVILKNYNYNSKLMGFLKDKILELPEKENAYMNYYSYENNSYQLHLSQNFLEYQDNIKRFKENFGDSIARTMLNGDVNLISEKLVAKLPNMGDTIVTQKQYLLKDYPPSRYITVCVPVNGLSSEVGSMFIASGVSKDKIIYQTAETPNIDKALLKSWNWKDISLNLDDILVIDSYAPFYNNPNFSSNTSYMFYFTYNLASEGNHRESYFAKQRETHIPNQEMLNAIKEAIRLEQLRIQQEEQARLDAERLLQEQLEFKNNNN